MKTWCWHLLLWHKCSIYTWKCITSGLCFPFWFRSFCFSQSENVTWKCSVFKWKHITVSHENVSTQLAQNVCWDNEERKSCFLSVVIWESSSEFVHTRFIQTACTYDVWSEWFASPETHGAGRTWCMPGLHRLGQSHWQGPQRHL